MWLIDKREYMGESVFVGVGGRGRVDVGVCVRGRRRERQVGTFIWP